MMNNILAIGLNNSLGKKIVSQLLQNNYNVHILKIEKHNDLSPKIKILPIDLSNPDSITKEYLSSIEQIIICVESDHDSGQNFGNTGLSLEHLKNLFDKTFYLPDSTEKIIFDFSNCQPEIANMWGSVNDVVMGGVSQSNFQVVEQQAIFTGNVSTENNGGFASVRTRNFDFPLDLSEYQGIELRVKGDGKRYKFIARCEGAWDGISYCYSFDTVYNIPITVRIPFAKLRPVVRAKTYDEAGEFDPAKVYSLQLMLSKFEYDGELNATFTPGKFSLSVESIKAYGGEQKPQLLIVSSRTEDSLKELLKHSALSYKIVNNFPLNIKN